MAQPFEAHIADSTAAAEVYIRVLASGTTTADVHAALNKMRELERPGGPLDNDYSPEFIERGVAYLVAAGLVRESEGTLTPVFTVDGKTRAIRRAANDFDIELDPTVRPQPYGLLR